MSFPKLPPIPADPELVDSAKGENAQDFVDQHALQRALLGAMPSGEGGAVVRTAPPRGDYAGLPVRATRRVAEPSAEGNARQPAASATVVSCPARRAGPPRSRRLGPSSRSAPRRSDSRAGGVWVFLSSAAASVVLLLAASLAVTRLDYHQEEPRLTPPVPEAGDSAVVEGLDPDRGSRLAATTGDSF
jgi:hypothetical protein